MENKNREILAFLSDLRDNNMRPWFQANKARYDAARAHLLDTTAWLIAHIARFDDTVRYLEPKECLFRIYRDTRFSPDKSPYKRHFGTYICAQGGHRSILSGYYLHLEPGHSALCGGVYCPDKETLKRVRTAIDIDYDEFERIIAADDFRQHFGTVVAYNTLQRVPQGFSADSLAAKYLKFKEFIVEHHFTDDEVCAPDFFENLLPMCQAMKPFNDFMNAAILES